MKQLHGLYVITDAYLTPSHSLINKVHQTIMGGAQIVQYRDKGRDCQKRRQEIDKLLGLCRNHGVTLIVNDDIELARLTGADGVHVGKEDVDPRVARNRLGENALIGVSCYNDFGKAIDAQKAGADYVAFGSFFSSPTKPNAVKADLSLLAQAKEKLNISVCAIGGITATNAKRIIDAGADMIAVINGVFAHENPQDAARQLSTLFLR